MGEWRSGIVDDVVVIVVAELVWLWVVLPVVLVLASGVLLL